VLEKDDGPKYLNSPETALFHKGRELYGLFEARRANAKLARLVVVEGYMDVVSLHHHGVNQAVATLGTATTKDHAELLFRNAPDVHFCFDGDRAGRAAAWRAVESVLPRMREGRQAWFVFLPEGEDPDTLIAKEGIAGFEQRLAAATPLSEFFYAHQEADVRLDSADGRARLADKCKAAIATIPDGAFKDRMVEMLTEKSVMGWSLLKTADPALREQAKELLDERLAQTRRAMGGDGRGAQAHDPGAGAAQRSQAATGTARRSVVRSAIALLVQQPALAQSVSPPYLFSALRQPGIPLLTEMIALARARPEITTGGVLEHFSGREEAHALAKLAVTDLMIDPAHFEPEFTDCLKRLDRQCEQQRLDELKARLDHLDRSELEEYTRLQRSLRGVAPR
jgi:DNA primase